MCSQVDDPSQHDRAADVSQHELERLRRVEAAARALDAEPWTTAAGKPSRRQLTANLRAALQDADARGGGAR